MKTPSLERGTRIKITAQFSPQAMQRIRQETKIFKVFIEKENNVP